MLIKIDKSALNNLKAFTVEDLECIENIAKAVSQRNHIVISDYENLEALINIEELSTNTRRIFNSIKQKSFTISGVEKIVNSYLLVVSNLEEFHIITEGNKTIYRVPLKYFNRIEKILPLHLIGEDDSDCMFYENMAKKYLKEEKLGLGIKIMRVHGGGEQTWKTYKKELIEYNKICLAIADSDKLNENSNLGVTAHKIKKVYDENKLKYVTNIHILKVREKENLIQPNFYMMCTNSSIFKKDLEILKQLFENKEYKKIYYYLDIKDGVWYEDLHRILSKETFDEISATLCAGLEKSKIINGIGSMFERVRCEIICQELEERIKYKEKAYLKNDSDSLKEEIDLLKKNLKLTENLFEALDSELKEEWCTICKKIIDLGCCLNQFIA